LKRLGLGLLLCATVALGAKPKVVVDAPPPMNKLLTAALKKKFTPVAAKKPMSDEPLSNETKTVVREAGGIGVVLARLSGGAWSVLVLNGADGTVLEQLKVPAGKKPLKVLPKGFDGKLAAALADAKAPGAVKKEEPPPPDKEEPVPAPGKKEEPVAKKEEPTPPPKKGEPVAKKETVKPTAPPNPPKEEPRPAEPEPEPVVGEKPVALRAGIGFHLFSRRFYYNQDLFGTLSKYTLNVGPAIGVEADWFPGAHVTRGVIANIGLSLGFDYAVGITSVATDGTKYSTSALKFRVGAQYRIEAGPVEILPTVGFMLHSYSIASGASAASKPNIPDVGYSALRFGVNLRAKLIGPLLLTGGFAYDLPLSTGEIGSANYFPHAKAGGLDANFGVAVDIGSRLELRAGIDYTRYWFSLNPEVTDPGVALNRVAGGALDDYKGAYLTVCFVL
jgi:hypothetical protein